MKKLAESKRYIIFNEYEQVFLQVKLTSKLIRIGEFYGDPDIAIISNNELFCVVGGEGIIIYYLKEPFEEYSASTENLKQWKSWGRDIEKETIWVNNITQEDSQHISVELENGEKTIISIY